MAGKEGRSSRPSGSTSWWRNPVALAGHHLNGLIEMWLAGVPIRVGPKRWLLQPMERRHTVPPRIMRVLAEAAIAQMLHANPGLKRPDVDLVLAWARRRAPAITLRRAARLTPRDKEREAAFQEYLDDMASAWKK
jgi:hypothetical protein